MEKENQILDILRLYEYSMSIGKSLNYYDNCEQFLKLLLKRRNLNACWILRYEKNNLIKEYSIPFGNQIKQDIPQNLYAFLDGIHDYTLIEYDETYSDLTTFPIQDGFLAVLKLKLQGYLFLYSKENNISPKDLSQLLPVINKFANTLEACKAYDNQQSLLKRLEERNTELNNYAHIVSHDLKSPLRNIDALLSWLKEDHSHNLDEGALHYIDLIGENISRMEALVSGILEYSTIGLKNFKTSFIDLNKIIDEILNHIYIPENIEIIKHENFPIIQGDTYRLQQLFQNLIGNAIKYNDKKEGVIEVGFQKHNNKYTYFVKDNGKGIDKRYHTKIFSVFQKLEASKNSTGIGLSIVEKIVISYGGKVWLTSEVNKGTTFFFTLKNKFHNRG